MLFRSHAADDDDDQRRQQKPRVFARHHAQFHCANDAAKTGQACAQHERDGKHQIHIHSGGGEHGAVVHSGSDHGAHAGAVQQPPQEEADGDAKAQQAEPVRYFPIALWLLDRALRRGSGIYGFASGIIAGLMLLGRDQVAFLGLITLAAYTILRLWDSGWRIRASVKPLLGGSLGGLLTVTIPMVMTLLLAADSNRPIIDLTEAGKGSLHPWSLLTAIIPHLYGIARPLGEYWGPPSPDWGWVDLYLARNMATFYFGILPVLGLLLLPFLLRFQPHPVALSTTPDPHRRDGLFLACGFVLLILYSLGRYTPFFQVVFALIPGIDKFRRPADALFVACALGSMAGGYALHCWIVSPRFVLPRWALPAFAALVLFCWVAGAALAYSVGRFEQTIAPLAAAACFLSAGLLALMILHRLEGRVLPMMLAAALFMSADLGWNNAPNESTGLNPDSYDVLRPDTSNETIVFLKQKLAENKETDRLDRVELVGLGFHWPNVSLNHGLHHTLGYNPLRSGIYSTSVGARDHIAGPDQRLFTPLMPSYSSVLADLVGLRYIAISISMQELYAAAPRPNLPPAIFDAEAFPLAARTGDAYIYENPRALPRVIFAGDALRANFDDLIKTGQWPVFDPRQTILLDRELLPAEMQPRNDTRSVRILSYQNTEIIIEAQSETGGFVTLNDSWDDWWQVEVDGKVARIERANVAFRAVGVPPGKHQIRFVFRPFSGALNEILGRK